MPGNPWPVAKVMCWDLCKAAVQSAVTEEATEAEEAEVGAKQSGELLENGEEVMPGLEAMSCWWCCCCCSCCCCCCSCCWCCCDDEDVRVLLFSGDICKKVMLRGCVTIWSNVATSLLVMLAAKTRQHMDSLRRLLADDDRNYWGRALRVCRGCFRNWSHFVQPAKSKFFKQNWRNFKKKQ